MESLRSLIARLWRQSRVNWALMDQAMVSAANFLSGVLMVRYLGVAEFGVFTIAWLTIELLYNIQFSLIIGPMVSILPKQPSEDRPAYIASVLVKQGVLTLLIMLLYRTALWGVGFFGDGAGLVALSGPLSAVVLACLSQNFVRRYFFATGSVVSAFFVDLIRYGGQLLALFWLLRTTEMGTGGVLWIYAASAAIAVVFGCFFFEALEWSPVIFRQAFVRHWRFARWLVMSEIMRWVSGNIYTIVAGAVIGPVAVGAIRGTQNLMGLCHVFLLGFENVVPVTAARRYHEGGMRALSTYLGKVGLLGGAALGVVIAIAAVAPAFWLGLIYGDAYEGYAYLVWWWAVSYSIGFMAGLENVGLRALEETKPIFLAFLISSLVAVATVYPP